MKVVVTADRNGDGVANWQDAALVCRAMMPKPFGSELVRATIAENIGYNFASGAQQPFLRVNLRPPDGCFGVDSTAAAQKQAGRLATVDFVTVRMRQEADKVFVEARNENDAWQTLATFPREKFPGTPDRVRIGKMDSAGGSSDYGDPGPASSATILSLRIYRQ